MSAKRKFWLAGLAVAAAGVVLARVISGQFDQPGLKLAIYAIGTILAFAGLALIMMGIKKA